MVDIHRWCSSILFFFLLMDNIFESHAATGRSLLQSTKPCPVNFEHANYTIITSQCKGPEYPPNKCCGAFKEFACPYVDQINDLTTDCSSTMFSYIDLNGKYPAGLFGSECVEGKKGLACPASPPSMSENASRSQIICSPSPLLKFIAGFLILICTLL